MKQEWTREDVGGSYFHPKVDNQIIKSVLLRDCVGLNNGCDYEVIINTEDGVQVEPIEGDWIDHGLVKHYIEQTPK
tara:strand:- start:526 stop:753 length:228 start_codon:yes stop_codon:yes gene_type:complete